eukprot:TRINITY_DN87622_c0_g1_i1.p1 TRINITY_DN87622_c0_g1~~TRINITY_DN87622_c0_g1_i1.p1  ORF type:complete len:651 (-),score=98.56 TRINITY_DN87622_c0_g1_i1:245-2197(-)
MALLQEEAPLMGDKDDDMTAGQCAGDDTSIAHMYLDELLKGYAGLIDWITRRPLWTAGSNEMYVAKNHTIRSPGRVWMNFAAIGLVFPACIPLLGTSLVFVAAANTVSKVRASESTRSHCSHFVGTCISLFLALIVLVAAWSPVLLLVCNYTFDMRARLVGKRLSGISVCGPAMFCAFLSLYTAAQATEQSTIQLVLTHMSQEFVEMATAHNLVDFMQELRDRIAKISTSMIPTSDHSSEERLFDEHLMLLDKDDLGDMEAVSEYCAYKAREQTNVSRLVKLTSSPWIRGIKAALSLLHGIIPFCWMRFGHNGGKYLHRLTVPEILLECAGFIAFVLTTYIAMSVSWTYLRDFRSSLVRQAAMIFLYSPDVSRRFVYDLYKHTLLEGVMLGNGVSLGDALDAWRNKRRNFIETEDEMERRWYFEALVSESYLRGQMMRIDMSQGTQEVNFTTLDAEAYQAVSMWMKVGALITRVQITSWLHIMLVGGVMLLTSAMVNVFLWRQITAMTLANMFACIIITFVLYMLTSLAITYIRIRVEDSTTLLQTWQDVIRKEQQKMLKDKEWQKTPLDRLCVDNYFRGLLEPLDQMIARIAEFDTPIEAFGIPITSQTVNRAALAVASILVTGAVNYIRESDAVSEQFQTVVSEVMGH